MRAIVSLGVHLQFRRNRWPAGDPSQLARSLEPFSFLEVFMIKRTWFPLSLLVVMALARVVVNAGEGDRSNKHDPTRDSRRPEPKVKAGEGSKPTERALRSESHRPGSKVTVDEGGRPAIQTPRAGSQRPAANLKIGTGGRAGVNAARGNSHQPATNVKIGTGGRAGVNDLRGASQQPGLPVDVAQQQDDEHGPELDVRSRGGLSIAPVPLNLRGKNRQLVGLGSYLVNTVGGCNGCHAVNEFLPGGNPYLGQPRMTDPTAYMAGGASFGTVISTNLRPVGNTGRPAGLNYQEFVVGLRHGIDFRQPGVIQQVSPWPSFKNMTNNDLRAIYEYLSALPAQAAG
jgi:hypothetical protein